MEHSWWLVLFLCVNLVLERPGVSGARELLRNPGFENGISYWTHDGFNMQTDSTHVHKGLVSIKCTGRTKTYHGPAQDVHIVAGRRYVFQSYIKLINDVPAHLFQEAVVKIAFTLKDGTKRYFPVCSRPYLTVADDWTRLGGDFTAPTYEWTRAHLYIEGLEVGIEFYFDEASLTELADNPNWEAEANHRIDNLRKSNIHFKFNVASNFDPADLEVQIDLKKHLFGFGSLVRSDLMIDPDFKQYQDVVTYMFNWASIQDYKWRYDRGTRAHPDYTTAIAATDVLRKNGLQVRGHCMFWAVDSHSPNWATSLSGDLLKAEVDRRIQYMTDATRGKLAHWDVNNELIHGHFFESRTRDPNYSKHMFRKVHAADHTPVLFLNDYNVVASGQMTSSYLTQIQQFKSANLGLGAVGVQSHLPDFKEPDPNVLKYRLDILAQAGLPIWITELDIASSDEKQKADWYEKALRLYFSHPAVEGVILWGFWDHDMSPTKALVRGYTYTLDEAGKRYVKLTKQEWSTHEKRSLSAGTSFSIRGFQGDYGLTVLYKGKPIKYRTFTLGKTDKTITTSISGDGHEIHLDPALDPWAVQPGGDNHATTSQHLHTLGSATSTSQSNTLHCVSRFSAISAVGDDKFVDVQCQSGEILTGCSSSLQPFTPVGTYPQNQAWQRDGEKFVFSHGKPTCRAIDGYGSSAGVQAVARCCSLKGLACTYKTAGPSATGVDDQVVIGCPSNQYPLGCATWTFASHSDGSLATNTTCIGQNDDPSSGVYVYAACCHGGNIHCLAVTSSPGGLKQADKATVTCPLGYVMTGCNVFSKYGRAAGAYITSPQGKETCNGVNGADKYGGEIGVQAVATCCYT